MMALFENLRTYVAVNIHAEFILWRLCRHLVACLTATCVCVLLANCGCVSELLLVYLVHFDNRYMYISVGVQFACVHGC